MKECAEIEGYVPGTSLKEVALKHAGKVVNLASNENPYGASPKALEAFRNFTELHRYPDPRYAELREKIADYTGWDFEEIVVAAGIDGVLETIFRFAVAEGDEVLLAPPTFSYYRILAKLSCARIVEAKRNENFEVVNASELVSGKTRLAIFCSPNNPTGNLENFEEVRAVAESIKGLVVVDEAYVEFADRSFEPTENVVIARTFSKAFGLANLRVGYARLPAEVAETFRKVSSPFPISTASERAAIAALEDVEWMKSCVEKIKRGRERLYRFLSKKFVTWRSQANFVLFRGFEGLDIELAKRGVLIRECSSFGLPQHYRVTVGREEEIATFEEALEDVLCSSR
ncbi:MAG: histidinol-phosphate transaminase [Archaeoglobaceae archaeon]